LHRLIRANEQLVHDFTDKYFNRALACFLESHKNFEAYLRQAVGLTSNGPDWTRMFNPFANPFLMAFAPQGNGHSPSEPSAETAALRRQIDELKAQMEQLQQKLNTSA